MNEREASLENILYESSKRLPGELLNFLMSGSWETALAQIGKDFNLTEDHSTRLAREVILVLLGIVHPDAFRSMLAEQFERYDDAIDAMAFEIDDKVFAPIRPALVKFFESEQASHKETEVTSLAQQQETEIPVSITAESINKPEKVPETVTPPEKPRVPAEFFPETPKTIAEATQNVAPEPSLSAQALELAKIPSRMAQKKEIPIPRDLPTQETSASFLPNLAPKTATPERPLEKTAPFEDKLKRVFTSGTPTPEGTKIETTPAIKTPEKEEPVVMTTPAQIFPEKTVVTQATPLRADPYREPIE